jgi:23S rRNA pseudouridine1911/1915/1917 synthase
MEKPQIIFEDRDILVVNKPYGILSEESERLPSLPAMLREHTGGTIYPVHRLDRTTEGLMVYAKTRAASAQLSASIQRNELTKTYLAVAEGIPEEAGELHDLLYFDRRKGKSFVVDRERKGVKPAVLRYTRLSTAETEGTAVSLIRIRLVTGRTHQIRIQFASRRMPLVGDRRYGSHIRSENIALCACELTLPHPISGEELRFTCAPTEKVFALFQ